MPVVPMGLNGPVTSPSRQLTLGPGLASPPVGPALAGFHPAVAEWFRRRFREGPTTPQAEGWPHIAAGHDLHQFTREALDACLQKRRR